MRVETRERLIEAAAEELWSRGYAATSPNRIQRRASAGQGSMYHHFRGKADLARAAIGRSSEALRARTDEALAGLQGLEAVIAYLRIQRDPLRGCPVGRLAADADIVADPSLRDPVAAALHGIRERVRSLLTDEPACAGPDVLAATVAAVVQGGYVLARAAGDRAPYDAAIEGAVALLGASTNKESR